MSYSGRLNWDEIAYWNLYANEDSLMNAQESSD